MSVETLTGSWRRGATSLTFQGRKLFSLFARQTARRRKRETVLEDGANRSGSRVNGGASAAIEPVARVVRIHLAGFTLAETRSALILREPGQPAVIYVPREDVDEAMMVRSSHRMSSPDMGACIYFHLPDAGQRGENAAWTFENPPAPFEALKAHVAFDPRGVDWIQIQA